MNITVVGTGYVGIVTAAVFAEFGNQVWGVDVDPKRVDLLKTGKSPIYEPRLEEFIQKGLAAKRLHFTTDYQEALKNSQVVFVCVGTPQDEKGEVELKYVKACVESIAKNASNDIVIVLKSTVPPGIHKQLKTIVDQYIKFEYQFASVPEFLREGSAISDTLEPSRVVIGTDTKQASEILLDLHKPLTGERVLTDIISAQMIKYAANAFLATKISFSNSIAQICDLVDGDVKAVMKGIGLDPRIGQPFLSPGLGFGGSCFPKDIKGLYFLAKDAGYDFRLLKEVDDINQTQVSYLVKRAEKMVGSFENKTVGLLGLAFKPETDDMRDARSSVLIAELLRRNAKVQAYDPISTEVAKQVHKDTIKYCESAKEAVKDADVVFLVTEWNEFRELDLNQVAQLMSGKVLVDGRNIYDPEKVKQAGLKYLGVGRR